MCNQLVSGFQLVKIWLTISAFFVVNTLRPRTRRPQTESNQYTRAIAQVDGLVRPVQIGSPLIT
jgi:hypothetical protein